MDEGKQELYDFWDVYKEFDAMLTPEMKKEYLILQILQEYDWAAQIYTGIFCGRQFIGLSVIFVFCKRTNVSATNKLQYIQGQQVPVLSIK